MDEQSNRMRVDKCLWTIRQFKTRSMATTACNQGKIMVQGNPAKASRLVQSGDEIRIKRTGFERVLLLLKLSPNRLNPKLVPEFVSDITPKEVLEALKARTTRITIYRDPGTGRPTKRERRALDDFMDENE